MPGATNCIVDKKPLGKWPVIVRAHGADREKFLATTGEDDRLTLGMAEHMAPSVTVEMGTPCAKSGPSSFVFSSLI